MNGHAAGFCAKGRIIIIIIIIIITFIYTAQPPPRHPTFTLEVKG